MDYNHNIKEFTLDKWQIVKKTNNLGVTVAIKQSVKEKTGGYSVRIVLSANDSILVWVDFFLPMEEVGIFESIRDKKVEALIAKSQVYAESISHCLVILSKKASIDRL